MRYTQKVRRRNIRAISIGTMAGRCCVKGGSIAFAKSQLTMIGLLFASGASSSSSSPSNSHGNHATKWHLVTRLLGLPPKAMTQRGNDVSNMCRFLPKLTVNGQFIRDFIAAESPCFALGLVEERKQLCGFLALRPAEVIPPEISGLGFNFGHALLGTTEFEVIQFVFHFNGFETYNMLVNPNNRLVKKMLTRMVESGDYFFLCH